MRKATLVALICSLFLLLSCAHNPEPAPPPSNSVPIDAIEPQEDNVEGPVRNTTVEFTTFDFNEFYYYRSMDDYVELNLKLPELMGDYEGIPAINDYFLDKEHFFYNELPWEYLQNAKDVGNVIRGKETGFYREAYYSLELIRGDIISISAALNGGAGGVSWDGIEGNTFNLVTGEKLGLSDIFSVDEEEYMQFICHFVSVTIDNAISEAEKNGDYTLYLFGDAFANDGQSVILYYDPENFYLTEDALVVFYPKYALTAGAAGPQVFRIPYADIADKLAIDLL